MHCDTDSDYAHTDMESYLSKVVPVMNAMVHYYLILLLVVVVRTSTIIVHTTVPPVHTSTIHSSTIRYDCGSFLWTHIRRGCKFQTETDAHEVSRMSCSA